MPSAPPPPLLARVEQIADLTYDVRSITLRLVDPQRLRFSAGQFVSFSIERPGQRFPATRAYTIASSPDTDDRLVLVLNRVQHGPGSDFLFGLKVGDEVPFKGPYGTFVLRDDDERDLLFVATFTGIVPFMSMLSWLSVHQPTRRVTLVWGTRSERELFLQDELEAWAATMPQLTTIVTLSQPSPSWSGRTGRVQAAIAAQVQSVDHLSAYLCGNGDMIADVVRWLKEKGSCPIFREPYFNPSRQKPAPPTTSG